MPVSTRSSGATHVSAAIVQLRRWVTLAACALAVCAISQMLVFGLVRSTDVRWSEVRSPTGSTPLRVVGAVSSNSSLTGPHADAPTMSGVRGVGVGVADGKAASVGVLPSAGSNAVPSASSSATDVNRVLSPADRVLERVCNVSAGVGVLSAVALMILTVLGVAVAGGGAVPGVERAVTACAWSIVLAGVCLPWSQIMPTMGIPGVFTTYTDLVMAIDGSGSIHPMPMIAAMAQWVAAPAVALFASLGVVMWFRAGVERGVIVDSVSQLDQAVAREVQHIQRQGVAISTPRSVGALQRAVGEGAETPVPAMAGGGDRPRPI